MYPTSLNQNGANRLPRADARSSPPSTGAHLARSVGTVAVQAVVIIVVAKVVDALFEAFMAKRRAQQAHAPQRARREEHAVA